MIEYTNECCDCSTPTYPCLGKLCPKYSVKTVFCDMCGEEIDSYYEYKNKEFCDKCILQILQEDHIIEERW